jgi:uncharacterized glyoxalase superfamily protein PhnB
MLQNRSMPACTVIPELGYPDVSAAIDWLCGTFGFTLRLRIANHRAQLNVGGGAVVLTARPDCPAYSVMVRVEDVDRHYEVARQRGAHVVQPPSGYPYGERQYTVEDPAGHRWTFSQTIADIDPGGLGLLARLITLSPGCARDTSLRSSSTGATL